MTTVLDASSALGNYMLKGWVLTDRTCPTSGCRIPLLRSPAGQNPVAHLCVNCDENLNAAPATQADVSTPTSTSSASHLTRVSTPATEVSDATDELPPFVESEEARRRREQTDRASAEIGRRLLQGWTMMGDECPRDECFYVPLVRPPRTGGKTNPKKECVLCSSTYTTEKDWAGRDRLFSVSAGPTPQAITPASNAHLLADPASQVDILPPRPVASNQPEQVGSILTGKEISNQIPTIKGTLATVKASAESITGTLNASSEALQLSLQTLTTRLTLLTSNVALADPTSIATTADAITKVIQALSQVKQLQWSETQASAMT